jgi:hypothetical protein
MMVAACSSVDYIIGSNALLVVDFCSSTHYFIAYDFDFGFDFDSSSGCKAFSSYDAIIIVEHIHFLVPNISYRGY